MRYEEPAPVDRAEAARRLATGAPQAISETLVALALSGDALSYAQAQCLSFLRHADEGVRGTAVLCLGHLARLHGTLHLDLVLPLLDELAAWDPPLRGRIADARDDIDQYAT